MANGKDGMMGQEDIKKVTSGPQQLQEVRPVPVEGPSAAPQDMEVPELNGSGTITSTTVPSNSPLTSSSSMIQAIDLLGDVELNVKIELGRTRMLVEDVLKLGEGSVVELDKLAGDPVDVFVNDQLVAHGEVLVLNDNCWVRVNEIVKEQSEG